MPTFSGKICHDCLSFLGSAHAWAVLSETFPVRETRLTFLSMHDFRYLILHQQRTRKQRVGWIVGARVRQYHAKEVDHSVHAKNDSGVMIKPRDE